MPWLLPISEGDNFSTQSLRKSFHPTYVLFCVLKAEYYQKFMNDKNISILHTLLLY